MIFSLFDDYRKIFVVQFFLIFLLVAVAYFFPETPFFWFAQENMFKVKFFFIGLLNQNFKKDQVMLL